MAKLGRRHFAQEQGKRKNDVLQSLRVDEGHSEEEAVVYSKLKLKNLVTKVNPNGTSIVWNVKPSQFSKLFLKELFLRRVYGMDSWIPKHVVSVDEKHLRSCLEIIHISALKGAQCNNKVNCESEQLGIVSGSLYAAKLIKGEYLHSAGSLLDLPLAAGTRSFALKSGSQWIPGSIMQSQSMLNILKSHLFLKVASSDNSVGLKVINLNDVRKLLSYDSPDSVNSEKETPENKSHTYGDESSQRRRISMSSTMSTVSECSSSGSAAISQGLMQCTWEGRNHHFVFSIDNQKEVYIASLQKAEQNGDNVAVNSFLFHLSKSSLKDKASDIDSKLIGKMNVSMHFSVCSNNSKVKETEYVLYTSYGIEKDMQNSVHNHKKKKGLPKKMVEVFRTSASLKHRKLSIFDGASSIPESCPWEPSQIVRNTTNDSGMVNMLEPCLPSNYESAAIIVKEHVDETVREEKEVGGWGLKFLKKSALKQSLGGVSDGSKRLNHRDRNSNCTLSMDILIPAGFHGGPKTITDGPSSLAERWRSGGHCDCGGWDTGCPVTVLECRSCLEEPSSHSVTKSNYKSFDIHIQGSKNADPLWRMENINDGLYFINFQQPLSALQSFSIAVAIIHRQIPNLQSSCLPDFT